MSKDKKTLYYLSSIVFLALFFALFLPIKLVKIIVAILLFGFCFLISYYVKKRSILSVNKKEVLMLMGVIGLVYVMAFYMTGIKFGFYKSLYQFSFSTLLIQIIPIVIIIISIEIIRSILLAQEKKYTNILSYLSGVVVDILLFSSIKGVSSFNGFMDLVGMTLLPAFVSNFLYQFIAKKYGCYPNIVYRLIITLYSYIIPFVSAMSESMEAFIKLIIPLVIYFFINILYEKKKKVESHKSRNVRYAGFGIVFIIMISIAMLISCQFKYGLMVIGSDSMTGEINKGDAVLFVEYDDQIIKEGQVILFRKDNVTVVHRVVKIESIDGEIRYYTKGDTNDYLDSGYITKSNIIGLTNFKIAYIGYPTIWIRELFLG